MDVCTKEQVSSQRITQKHADKGLKNYDKEIEEKSNKVKKIKNILKNKVPWNKEAKIKIVNVMIPQMQKV